MLPDDSIFRVPPNLWTPRPIVAVLHHKEVTVQTGLSKALSALDDEFSNVKGYDVVPDGEYWAVVEDVILSMVSSGHPKITWAMRILGPSQFGRKIRRNLLIRPDTLRWLKKDLYLCGLGLDSLGDLPGRLDNLINLKVRVRKSSREVQIMVCDGGVGREGHLFLHFIDGAGSEYLDQQLTSRQFPHNKKEFGGLIACFAARYGCPHPDRAYIEDAKSGSILFSTDH